MNILELDTLNSMLGKAVSPLCRHGGRSGRRRPRRPPCCAVCCIGHLADMTLEQTITGVRIHLEIAPTPDTMKKMEEYSKIMGVMAEKTVDDAIFR